MAKKISNPQKNTAHPEGVFPALKKNGEAYFRASLTCRRKHISLGSFPTAEEAHAAYLEGRRVLEDNTLTPENYPADCPLPFEKWVCLANYRDNGIYFGNPIYVGRRLFYYYLSPAKVLKFDPDDLFYYSSHKIMSRGNKGQYIYTVRIHVNGNLIVGRYDDEITAAIAYNKAADILKRNGLKKNFPQNYIEGLSPSRYAELYSSLQISPKILNLYFSE